MKLSNNSISMLIFALLAAVLSYFMAKRPAVEGNTLNFGMPLQSQQTGVTAKDTEEVVPKAVESMTTEPVEVQTEEVKPVEATSEPASTSTMTQEATPQQPATIEGSTETPAATTESSQ